MENINMDKKKLLTQLKKLKSDESKCIWLLSQVEQMEKNFEKANDIITDKCESLIKEFFSESIGLPAEIKRLSIIGQRYENFVQAMRFRIAVDEGLVAGEAKELLTMAQMEIKRLRAQKNKIYRDTQHVRNDMRLMQTEIYMHEQISKLKTDKQRTTAKKLCEGAKTKNKINQVISEVKKNARNENKI